MIPRICPSKTQFQHTVPPILTDQLTLFQLEGTDYAQLITTLHPPPSIWIFRPSYSPVMHLGVEYGNQTENRQKFAVFHPYVSFCIQEWMVFARKMTKGPSMSDYPDFI